MATWRGIVEAHVQTWRPYTLLYPGAVGWAGASVVGGAPGAGHLVAAVVIPVLVWLGGHYLGDWLDRHLDAIDKPQRPIPSGRLSPRTALISAVVCEVCAAVVAVAVGWRLLVLLVVGVVGIVVYSRVCKGRGISGNLVRGALTSLAVLAGATCVPGGHLWTAVPFAVVFLLHDAASNLVGAVRDVEGDEAGGYRSVPVLRGVAHGARLAQSLYGLALAAAVASVLVPLPDHTSYLALLVVATAIGAWVFGGLLTQGDGITRESALRAHEVLVVERLVLACAVAAAGVGVSLAVAVLVPIVAFSVITQNTMRTRYEIPPSGLRKVIAP
ncbi:UbiA family prenyltransferase [Umezawaea endophytica]|uniref:UbiA family prenyltransferase n=1 Tax=Umezawaea endophytica TaxID=1654476 RepID=A0A9X2VST6_9PSEU|nr:UbiA family prenyltransferase [Umezawaea endophytica]MCS7481991.1 UbiA family prenyltransferase [Umezawaea endophytica]